MSSEVKEKLKSWMEKFQYFCLALDGSTNIHDDDDDDELFLWYG